MPALNPPHIQRLTLNNGLTLSLRHTSHLKRCAAYLRVNAGSHDVPAAWPGLAHFLEHLLFLGTERFPAQDNLMAYVQRHGGHVNAHTSERHTDFFFELPPVAFEGGLERLCDMLAHPRLSIDDQLREREVLHAEFIAWAREPSAQRERALFEPLNPAHALRAFHAGNRYSLPVPRPSFQQALQSFYQQFYQTGQMSLSLVGPLPMPELKALAERNVAVIRQGPPVPQTSPLALMVNARTHYQQADPQHLNLVFTFEQLPLAYSAALKFLCHWLNADKPGSLLAQLRQQQLISRLEASVLYAFNGQALLQVEVCAPTGGALDALHIRETFDSWLAFFSAQHDWSALRHEFHLLQQRQQQVSPALTLARRDCEQEAAELSDDGVIALKAILKQMQPTAPQASQHTWRMPTPNPFLQPAVEPVSAGLIRGQTSAHRGLRTFAQDRLRHRRADVSAMKFSTEIPSQSGEAALYLRWRLAAIPLTNPQPLLETRLQSLRADALEAGVELSFNTMFKDWVLKMRGYHEPMPAILEQALRLLSAPLTEPIDSPTDEELMPIRQLLKQLSVFCVPPTLSLLFASPEDISLEQCWAQSLWDGLGVSLPAATQASISGLLSKVPGKPEAPISLNGHTLSHWHTLPCTTGEHALVMFCPLPEVNIANDATWRLLAHIAKTPFYQRLRVEQQLGYAVFSGLHQVNGQTGLLFGVQSPHACAADIYDHIQGFLGDLPNLISALDETSFTQLRAALAQQFSSDALSVAQASELLWQAKLAGHTSDYLQTLYNTLMTVDQDTTLKAAQRITQPECSWLCIATDEQTETFYLGRS